MTDTTTTTEGRNRKTADEKIADALAQLRGPAAAERTLEQAQREEAMNYVQQTLANTLADLGIDSYKGEGRELIAKAASSLTRALANAKAAIKATPAADLASLPGVSQ